MCVHALPFFCLFVSVCMHDGMCVADVCGARAQMQMRVFLCTSVVRVCKHVHAPMHVCVVGVYMSGRLYIQICLCASMYMGMCICVSFLCASVCVHVCVHVYESMSVCVTFMCVCTNIYAYVCACMHVYAWAACV
jgi:hypothetical protein